MHIIMGEENASPLREKYTVLELDTFDLPGTEQPVTAYCVIDKIAIEFVSSIDQYSNLHHNLLKNYRSKNWQYCEDALTHLRGQWCGELDTFYEELGARISFYKKQPPDNEWTGYINKKTTSSAPTNIVV